MSKNDAVQCAARVVFFAFSGLFVTWSEVGPFSGSELRAQSVAGKQIIALGAFRPAGSTPPSSGPGGAGARTGERIAAGTVAALNRAGFRVVVASGVDIRERMGAAKSAGAALLVEGLYERGRAGNLILYALFIDPGRGAMIDAYVLRDEWDDGGIVLDPAEVREADATRIRRFANRVVIRIRSNPLRVIRSGNLEKFMAGPGRGRPDLARLIRGREKTRRADQVFKLFREDVVVTATRKEERVTDAPASVTVITRRDILKYGYRNLAEALARVPEVYVHYDGHNYSADFRGFFINNVERRVLYLLNGMKLNDRFHFGDFYPDVIMGLADVERIEVVRGPGAALYGNNAVLGVVNIITRPPAGAGTPGRKANLLAGELSHIRRDSMAGIFQAVHNKQYGPDQSLLVNVSWFRGEILHDTHTGWENRRGRNGKTKVGFSTDAYFRADNGTSQDAFFRGDRLPNFNLAYRFGDFELGAFHYTKRVGWIWPKDNSSFGSEDSDRVWGTASLFFRYRPRDGLLHAMDFQSVLSADLNTNREIADFDVFKTRARIGNAMFGANRSAWIFNPVAGFRNYIGIARELNPWLKTDAGLEEQTNLGGGGTRFVYHGVDRTISLETQLSPYRSRRLHLMTGGGLISARYDNFQKFTFRDNRFIGWARFGGITNRGWTGGVWLQAIWRAAEDLTVTGGARYDYQYVSEVYRQLGGEQLYECTSADNVTPVDGNTCLPIRAEGREAKDLTPRISLNYRLGAKQNIRFLYAEAFRAVPPQEIIRLPRDQGDARSEKTRNFEIIHALRPTARWSLTSNIFRLRGTQIYAFNPFDASFREARGWSNTGGSIALRYRARELEFFVNATAYKLRRATDSYAFRVYPDTKGVAGFVNGIPLPVEELPLDSPESLLRLGASWEFTRSTFLALEILHNGPIHGQHPARNTIALINGEILPVNADGSLRFELVEEFKVPASTSVNLTFSRITAAGMRLRFKVDNLFDRTISYVLPVEAENSFGGNPNAGDPYARGNERPHLLPGFGRRYSIHVSHEF